MHLCIADDIITDFVLRFVINKHYRHINEWIFVIGMESATRCIAFSDSTYYLQRLIAVRTYVRANCRMVIDRFKVRNCVIKIINHF